MPEELKPKPTTHKSQSSRSTQEFASSDKQHNSSESPEDSKTMVQKIGDLSRLSQYPIRDLVTDAKSLGEYLHTTDVKTNQIRKFLDAINRLKAELTQISETDSDEIADGQIDNIQQDNATSEKIVIQRKESRTQMVQKIEVEVVMLKPKLAYAVARASKRQEPGIKRLNEVMSTAISKIREVKSETDLQGFQDDFERLVQLVESVIAYHKAKGGE